MKRRCRKRLDLDLLSGKISRLSDSELSALPDHREILPQRGIQQTLKAPARNPRISCFVSFRSRSVRCHIVGVFMRDYLSRRNLRFWVICFLLATVPRLNWAWKWT
jgi:hypothetical protein